MNTDELFIGAYKLPTPLSKQEAYNLIIKIKQGDEKAKGKLVEHNIRLVLSTVTRRFKTVKYNKKDLVSIGIIGLMKAIMTFDISKKAEFSTYATRCINNEIIMFLRKFKKYANDDSINRTIKYDKNNNELKVEDIIKDEINIEEEYSKKERNYIIKEIIKDLSTIDREIIMLQFGFYNNETYTQKEIAKKLSISQSLVSKLTQKILKQIQEKLEEKELIDSSLIQVQKNKIKQKKK